MRLSLSELELFNASSADPRNPHAQELLNVFGAEGAMTILDHMAAAPFGLLVDFMSHVWHALSREAQRRGESEYVPDFELV